jgi:hypothetical protein
MYAKLLEYKEQKKMKNPLDKWEIYKENIHRLTLQIDIESPFNLLL